MPQPLSPASPCSISPASAQARPGQLRAEDHGAAPVREGLTAEESATIRAQLIREIETLPEDDLQPRAIDSLFKAIGIALKFLRW